MKYDIIFITSQFNISPYMSGMGYRIWEIAKCLVHKHKLKVKVLAQSFENMSETYVDLELINKDNLDNAYKESGCFYINYGTEISILNNLKKLNKKIIFDSLMTPVETLEYQSTLRLETDELRHKFYSHELKKYLRHLKFSDLILVGSFAEYEVMLGQLIMSGIVNVDNYKSKHKDIITVPIGYSSDLDSFNDSQGNDRIERSLLWNGGLWNHYSVEPMLEAVKESNVGLEFLYKNGTANFKFIENYINQHQLSNVSINLNKLSYYGRHSKILKAGGLIVLTDDTLESYTTLRLRIRDSLLYKKPLIVSKYGLLGKFVEENNIGVTTENDSNNIRKSIEDLFQPQNYFSFIDSLKYLSEKHLYENTLNDVYKFIYPTNV